MFGFGREKHKKEDKSRRNLNQVDYDLICYEATKRVQENKAKEVTEQSSVYNLFDVEELNINPKPRFSAKYSSAVSNERNSHKRKFSTVNSSIVPNHLASKESQRLETQGV